MARQTARKGMRCGRLRDKTAGKRCKASELTSCAESYYWMARSDGLISVALVQLAELYEQDAWVYLKDVLERLLAHPNNRIEEL